MINTAVLLSEIYKRELAILYRYNENHDPETGRFTFGSNGYSEISVSDWFPEAVPGSHEVVELQEYTKDGVTYTVDGKHVVNDHTEHEKEIAQLLEDKVGGEIFLVPRVLSPQGIQTPDYIFNGVEYDLKTIYSGSKHAIYNAIHKHKKQANNFIIDVSNKEYVDDEFMSQIEEVFKSTHTEFVNELVIVKNDNISIYSRK